MCAQAIGEVGRLVVAVRLPLELLAARGEVVAGPGDERVEIGTPQAVEVAVVDESLMHADTAQEWAVPVAGHARWLAGGERGAHLGVIGVEQRLACHHDRQGWPLRR